MNQSTWNRIHAQAERAHRRAVKRECIAGKVKSQTPSEHGYCTKSVQGETAAELLLQEVRKIDPGAWKVRTKGKWFFVKWRPKMAARTRVYDPLLKGGG